MANLMLNKKLRVLYVVPGSNDPIGMLFALQQIELLNYLGVKVRTFRTTPSSGLKMAWRSLRGLRAEVKSFRPDLVHAHYGSINGLMARLAWTGPLVVTFHGTDLNPGASGSMLGQIVRWLASNFTALTAVKTIAVSSEVQSRLVWRKKRSTILPMGVNLDTFNEMDQEDSREFLGWPQNVPIVVFNEGNRPQIKGSDLAIATIDIVKNDVPDVWFVRLNNELPENMPRIYNAADCLLLTSKYEGSPMVVKEALACGLPIVSTDVGDVSERTVNVTPGDVVDRTQVDLAAAVVRVLEQPKRSNGRSNVLGLSTMTIAESVLALYKSIVSNR